MRKTLFLCLFLLTALLGQAKPKFLVGSFYHDGQTTTFEKAITLQSPSSDYARVLFSNDSEVWLTKLAELHFEKKALEHQENSDVSYMNMELFDGIGYFKLKSLPNDMSVFLIKTSAAEIEVHSTAFSVETGTSSTYIKCYEGKLNLTNSLNFKITVVEAGEEAIVTGADGDKNIVIRKYPIVAGDLAKWEEVKSLEPKQSIVWSLNDGKYSVKLF
jgi:hypothetical protein